MGHPQGTVTFVFTDIEGSTRLWQRHHGAMEAAYRLHDAILREAVSAHGGVIYKTIGDAFQIAFPTAPQAVSAALDVQVALTATTWESLGLPEPLRVRMAVHTGVVDPDEDGDYRSPVLNRLGRLVGVGHGGQVLLSAESAEQSRDHVPAGSVLDDLGAYRLKDLHDPEHIYQLRHPDLRSDFPALATLDSRPNNLPRQPTPFLGREVEIRHIADLLRQDDTHLLTLTGPGGTGKTRLAVQSAGLVVDTFLDGAWFVDLAPLTDPTLILNAIAEVLGIREAGGTSLSNLICDHLAKKKLLLVLDNLEQLLPEGAPAIGQLLVATRGLTILTTSRVSLRLRAERIVAVPPLELPPRMPLPSSEEVLHYDAARLFVERAQAVRGDFAITAENTPAIVEIVNRLDGLPLAIELAAARVRLLPPQAMLARLRSRLPLLTGGAQDMPERQRTLRGAIAWSHELLDEAEQVLFRRLAVFAGGASLDAIEVVMAGDNLGLDLVEGLERLIEHSLLRQIETEGEPRFGMLETIREYGIEQLEQRNEATEVHRRHAAFFLALAEEAEPGLFSGAQHRVLQELDSEHDNLRGALEWALVHQPGVAIRLVAAVHRFWRIRGHLSEGYAWAQRALSVDRTPSVSRVRLLEGAGVFAMTQTGSAEGVAFYQDSLALARELGDRFGTAQALSEIGAMVQDEGEYEEAERFLEEAFALAMEEDGERAIWLRLTTVGNLGLLARTRGDIDRAVALINQSLVLSQKVGDTYATATTLDNLGEAERARGDLRAASAHYHEAIRLQHTIGDREGLAYSFAGLASLAVDTGEAFLGARLAGGATALCEAIGATLETREQGNLDESRQAAQVILGAELYAAAFEAGRALSLEEMIAEALAFDVPMQDRSTPPSKSYMRGADPA
jgi:predicted ATPase/class 3 adenylate cyclase